MSDIASVAMDRETVDDFLGDGGVGVIALARDDEPYAIPVSYGYDGEHLYVRLGFVPESEKADFVRGRPRARLVVHDETPDGWGSVVAFGRLEETPEASLDSAVSDAIRAIDIPFFTIYDRPARDIDFRLYRFVVDDLTGRLER